MPHFCQLKDGRKLCYALYGPENGKPVFYFHGTPSSRLEPLLLNVYHQNLEQLLQQFQVRFIAVDRPGMGLSDYNPQNTFTTFAHDVQQLANQLNIREASVAGWSGAGPFELSLAFHFPQLIRQVYIVTGFTKSFGEPEVFKHMHANKYYFGTAKYAPWLLQAIMNVVGKKVSDKPLPRWLSQLPQVDHQLMTEPSVIKYFTTVTTSEACLVTAKGVVQEARLYFTNPGYELSGILQPVHYWWGNLDNVVIPSHPKAVEEQVPNAVMHYKKNEGHLSVYVNWMKEVVQTIAKE